MSNYLVSLVSDQTTPNVLFIKEMQHIDKYYFITTLRMEESNKTEQIVRSTTLEKPFEKIVVPHDDVEKIELLLKKIELQDDDHVFLNITGGTKIMMLAAFQYFSKRNAEIYYLTLGNNSMDKIFPYPLKKGEISYRLNLQEYLIAHGIEYKYSQTLHKKETATINFFKSHFQYNKNSIYLLREIRNDKKIKRILDKGKQISINNLSRESFSGRMKKETIEKIINGKEKILSFLKLMGFNALEMSKNDFDYLTGGWFEEYVFSLILEIVKPQYDNIALNVHIKKNIVNNELDVVFIKNNSLHVIECKTGLKTPFGSIIAETIYKQSALRNNFGIDVHSYLFTLEEIPEVHLKRAEEMRIIVIDKNSITNKEKIKKIF